MSSRSGGSSLCGYDVMAACDLPKVDAWVRFPLPALPFEHESTAKTSLLVTMLEPSATGNASRIRRLQKEQTR